jgi:hypothetical protein
MSSFADLEEGIKSNQIALKDLMGMMGKFASSTQKVVSSTDDLSKAQLSLGIKVDKHGKLINQAGAFVNSYGQEVSRAGESTGNFNKRTTILNATVSSFTKHGKAVSFLEGYSKYLKLGGSRLEYFAEYLSSAREELTIFGFEAAKARKVMYGFLPPGMFRLANKLSSSFQFIGGTLRKLKSGFSDAEEQMEGFKTALAVAKADKSLEEIEKLTALIKELEDAKPPKNLFTSIVGKFQSASKIMNKPLFNINENMAEGEDFGFKKKFKKMDLLSKTFYIKHYKKEALVARNNTLKVRKVLKTNFRMTLTDQKKNRLIELKRDKQHLKKKIDFTVRQGKEMQEAQAKLLGFADPSESKKAEKAVEGISKKLEELLETKKSFAGLTSTDPLLEQQVNEDIIIFKEKQIKAVKALGIAERKYQTDILKVGDATDFDPNIKRLKDLEATHDSIAAIEDEAINGIRKKYKDLYNNLGEMKNNFKGGIDNANILSGMENSMAGHKAEIEGLERMMESRRMIAEQFSKAGNVEEWQNWTNKYMDIQDTLHEKMEGQLQIQKAIDVTTAKGLGSTQIQKDILATQKLIKEKEKFIIQQQDIIAHAEKERIKIEADFAGGFISEGIRDNRINAQEDKQTSAEGQIVATEESIVGDETSLDNSNEQLDVLKDLKIEATKKLFAKFPIMSKIYKGWKFFTGLLPVMGNVLKMFAMSFIYITLAILTVILIIKAFGPMIKEAWSKMSDIISPFFKIIWAGLSDIWDGASKVLGALFGNGSFNDAVNGIIQIVWGLLQVLWGITKVLVVGLLIFWGYLIIEMVKGIWNSIKEAVYDSKKMAKLIVMVVAAVVMIALLFTTAPIWLVLVIGLVIWKVGTNLLKPITMGVTAIGNYIKGFANIYIKIYNGMMNALEKIPGVNNVKRIEKYEYKAFAKGGKTNGGLSLVGEGGAEFVTLPKGSTVHNNSESKNMVSALNKGNSQSVVNNFNITINARDTSDAEMRRMADKIGNMVNNKINRRTSMR